MLKFYRLVQNNFVQKCQFFKKQVLVSEKLTVSGKLLNHFLSYHVQIL